MKIRDIASIARKWKERASGATADYEAGVKDPAVPWATAAAAAEPNYEAGVTKSISQKLFGKGVRAAGNEKWYNRIIEVGLSRYAPGIAASEDEYQKGFGPYQAAIASLTLPPRGPKGDPKNIERVRVIAQKLNSLRITRGAA
jgi:hypothetical protein